MAETTSFLLLSFLGAIIIQCHVTALDTQQSPRDLNEEFNNHLKKIIDNTKIIYDGIDKIAQDLQASLNNDLEKIRTKIYKDIDGKIEDIEKLTEEAEANGKDVSECNSETLPKILLIREEGRDLAETCYVNSKIDISETAANSQNSLPDAKEIAKELNNKFLECENSDCQREMIRDASDKADSVHLELRVVLFKATILLVASAGKGKNCMENVEISTARESTNIFANFVDCVKRS